MRPPPSERIAPNAVTLWRIHGSLYPVILGGLAIFSVITFQELFDMWIFGLVAFALISLVAVFSVGIAPAYRAKFRRYEITPEELYLQQGFLVVRRTVIPLVRIENIDTVQGPLSARFGMMSVTVSTAAGTHEIPALPENIAESLRDQIAGWARTAANG